MENIALQSHFRLKNGNNVIPHVIQEHRKFANFATLYFPYSRPGFRTLLFLSMAVARALIGGGGGGGRGVYSYIRVLPN